MSGYDTLSKFRFSFTAAGATITGYDMYTSGGSYNNINQQTTLVPLPYHCIIPSTVYNGSTPYKVIAIANNQFIYTDLTMLTIPDGVLTIGANAFSNCPYLAVINLPKSSITLGQSCFALCPQLSGKSVRLTAGVIENMVFMESNLMKIFLGSGVTSIGGLVFRGNPTNANITSIFIPKGVISLGSDTFGLTNLSTIYFGGNSIPTIGPPGFRNDGFSRFVFAPTKIYYLDGTTSMSNLDIYGYSNATRYTMTAQTMFETLLTDGYTTKELENSIFNFTPPLPLQPAFSISSTPNPILYLTTPTKTVDLTTAISFTGGAPEITAIYSIPPSGAGMNYTITGTTLSYADVGSFPVKVSKLRGVDYANDVSENTIIRITPGTLSGINISGTPLAQTYNPSNKFIDLSSIILLTKAVSPISTTYSVSGTGLDYSITGTIMNYTNRGRYPIKVSISGGTNYMNELNIVADISINQTTQPALSVSGIPRLSIYNPSFKTIDLTTVVSLSGGAIDLSPIYSVSGGSPGYTISGTTLTYTNKGRFLIAISISGGTNYSNNVKVGADISVNQSELTDLSISGEPRVSDYTLLNKKVDLTSVLSLSGGAPDITPIYSISGGTGLIFSISGSILTYKDVGIYPIIVSMSGGTNYSNDKFVKTDISINKVVLPDLAISGTPIPKEYFLANKSFDLKSVVSLSGGAADISAIYSVSGGTGEYSISGSIFTYTNVGIWPIFVSMSGGKNYLNDVLVPTDISINQAPLLLSISGTPTTKTYSASIKTVDLTTIVTLSGGSDLSAIYSVSDSSTEYSISGTLFTYTNAGKFPISISMSGGSNYSNDIQIGADISINKAPWSFSVSGTPQIQTYYASNKTVDLSSAITLSGGATDVSPIYSISGGTGNYSISGTILTYTDFGRYTVAISISGGQNYSSDIRIGTDISINKAQLQTTVSGTPRLSVFDPLLKTVDLLSVVSLSGTVIDITPIYSVSGPGYTISGTTLTYIDRGLFTIAISLSGGTNYWNNIRLGADISVNQSELTDLSISGEPRVSDYTLSNKTVDLTSVLSLSGGAPDIIPIYSVSGSNLDYSISGSILTYKDVGIYPIIVSMSGGINYNNDKFVKTDISINQIPLSFSISGTPTPKEYFLANKSFDLTTVLTLSGGAQDISAIYSVSGGTREYSISGSIFTYTNVGIWPIFVSMSGGKNYSNDVLVPVDISINQAPLSFSISGTPLTKEYYLADKSFDLTSILTISGGAQDISAIYSVSGSDLDYSISGSIFTYTKAGIWPIWVSMSGGTNYTNDVLVPADISINKAPLSLSVSGTPTPTPYSASYKNVDLRSVITLSGGAQDLSAIYTVYADSTVQCLNQSQSNSVQMENFKYIFNNVPYDSHEFIGLHNGTYQLSGVPSSHPLGFVIDDTTLFEVTQGTVFSTNIVEGIQVTYYTGDITFQVKGDFNTISYACYYHGYMGGQTRLKYSTTCSLDQISISGTILSYFSVGLYPIIVSMSGGINYLNNVQVGVDISINQATLLPLSISGTPEPSTYTLADKTVDLTRVLAFSGGAQDLSAIYSVSGGTGEYSISGSIFTYTNTGLFPIFVSMSGGRNYSNDVRVPVDISINESLLLPLTVFRTEPSIYNLASKTIDLTKVITLSGGAQDISAIYSVSGSYYSISGTILTYENIGIFTVAVSMSGGINYANDVLVGADISVNQAELSPLSISGTPTTTPYTLSNKTVDLLSVITLSGGAQDISAIYSASSVIDFTYSISGTILYYRNVGTYPITVSMSGGTNYWNDVSTNTNIRITSPILPDIFVVGTPTPTDYNLSDKTVDLSIVVSLSGGAEDISPIYSLSGGTGKTYSISGTILTYTTAGLFPIIVSMSGGQNYSTDVRVGTDISINKVEQSQISISGSPDRPIYTLASKIVDLRSVTSLSGGAPDVSLSYSATNFNSPEYSVSGTFLFYENKGSYPITVTKFGGVNYWNDVSTGTYIHIDQSSLSELIILSSRPSPYNLADKTVDLTTAVSLSGGALDISAIYTISGGTGLEFSISGTIFTYKDVGTYPIIVYMSGGTNYDNDRSVKTDIVITKPALPDIFIFGEPRASTYVLLSKTVDLLQVLTLSGGAKDISAAYSVSPTRTDTTYSISGTVFTYEHAGSFPIIVSMARGTNYSNDVQVSVDISINQAEQLILSISGEPRISEYNLLDKSVDLTWVLTLSGGAQDISAIYSISGDTGLEYSISGTILTYKDVGTYPVIVSSIGGTNYKDNRHVRTDISVNQSTLLELSISGEPRITEYNLLNKTVDLTEVLTLSGGAQDISAIYSISGGSESEFSISGTILTYKNVGTFPIIVSMSGGTNYWNNKSVKTDISVNQSSLLELSISGEPRISEYNLLDKSVDLTSVLSLSGGAQDISPIYTYGISGGLEYSISGTILTYKDVGTFPVIVSMSGGTNYWNNKSVRTDISVNQSSLLELSISGEPRISEYNLQNKTVDLQKVLTLSGGAQDISAIYSISGETGLIYSISGTILTYKDVGTFPIIVSMSGGTNYWNDKSVRTDISVNKSSLLDLSISGEPLLSEYNLLNKTIDLTAVLTLSGGAQDISAIYSVSGGSELEYSISGTILSYKNVGTFPIIVSMSGGTNYWNNKSVKTDISVNQSSLLDLSISGEPRISEYNLQNKTVDLTVVLSLSGGAQDISPIYSVSIYSISGETGLEYSISGTILTYKNVGIYPVIVSMSGGTNYWNNKSVKTDISVNQSSLLDLSISGEPRITEYNLQNKTVDLQSVLTLSGGAQDISSIYSVPIYSIISESSEYSISGTILTYKNVGTYPIIVSMSGGTNYWNNKSVRTDISVNQSILLDLSISGEPRISEYNLLNKIVDLASVLTLSGGAQDISAIYSISGGTGLIFSISGSFLTYKNVGTFPIIVSMSGGTNYGNDKFVKTDISVNQSSLLELSISGEPRITEYNLQNKTVDLTKVLSLSGGAQDISAIYSISGGTGFIFSISGTILTYEDAGTYPIIVSMSGGTNYWNNKSVKTDIRVNQAPLPPFSISLNIPKTYTLSNKTVDLRSVLTLSGAALDLSAVYLTTNSTCTISGTILTYENAGSFPIIVSFTGGTNYSNNVQVDVDISINKAVQPPISIISNNPSTYTLDDKTVDLKSVLSLSGGAPDLSNTVLYSISGSRTDYSISGTILTYTYAGLLPIVVSISGGTNYSNHVLSKTDISINKAIQPPLSLTQTPSTFESAYKIIDLSSVLTLSGGAPDLRNTVIYSVSGSRTDYSISGTILTYTVAGRFPIAVSISGGTNYRNAVRIGTDISMNKATIPLSISGTPTSYVFDIKNKNVILPVTISLSGGSPGVVATYSGPNVQGQVLTYGNIGSYPVLVSVSGGINYTDTSAVTAIEITRATLPLSVTSLSYAYNPNKTVVLSSAISLSGGAQDVSAIYSSISSGIINSGILTYGNVGSYPVNVSVSGGFNYTDTSASTLITIYQATVPLSVFGTPTVYTFNFTNRNISLTSAISLTGGAPGVAASFSGPNISGSILTFTDADLYPVYISISGGTNYTDTFTSTSIRVNKATLPLSVSPLAGYTFNPNPEDKHISLLSAISLSGGAQDVSANYKGVGVNGLTLTYTDFGSYRVYVTISGGRNYTDTTASTLITIGKATQPDFVSSSYSVIYDPRSKTVDLSGKGSGGIEGATTSFSCTTTSISGGSILSYASRGVGDYTITATKSFPNYHDIAATYIVTIMYPNPAAGANAADLKAAGYSLPSLFVIGYTVAVLTNIGYTVAEIKEGAVTFGGFTSAQLTTLGYTAVLLQAAHYVAAELKLVGYSLIRLIDLGYTITTLLAADYTNSELKAFVLAGGFTATQLSSLGYTAVQLQDAGYTDTELRSVGYTPDQLIDLGFTSTKLLNAGYTPVELKLSVVSGGTKTVEQLTALGYTAAQMQAQEYTAQELKSVGFSLSQLFVTGYTTSALFAAGYTANEIQNSVPPPTTGVTVTQLRDTGFVATQLKPAGYSLSPLVEGGFSVQDLKDAAFSPSELLMHFPVTELYNVFTTKKEQATVTKAAISEMFSPSNSIVTGLPVASMIGYTFHSAVSEVTAVVIEKTRTFDASDFNNGSTAVYAIIDVSGSSVTLPTHTSSITITNRGNDTYTAYFASGAIYRDNLKVGNIITVDGLTLVIGSVIATLAVLTVSQLINKGLNTSVKLIDAGYDAVKLELAGYMANELEIAGFSSAQLVAVGYTATQLGVAGYNATRLQNTGFQATDLETAGYTESSLRAANYTATQLQTAKYNAYQLRLAGFTVLKLQELGYTTAQLEAAGFSREHSMKKNFAWLTTTSEHITFPEKNTILCHASSAAGETASTMESFKTCVVSFLSPGFAANPLCSTVEKRYATVTLYSNVINTETYGLTFRTRNIAGSLRLVACFEFNGTEIKAEFSEGNSFSMVLHENDVTVFEDDQLWIKIPRKAVSSICAYKTKFNLNHDLTEIKNISFSYFQNATNKISYTVPLSLSAPLNTFTFDYLEGAIHELRDLSAGNITLHVQNLVEQNGRIPTISTLIKSESIPNGLADTYVTCVYLFDTSYDVIIPANIQEKMIHGKTVMQDIRYFNVDGSGHILSDIRVYM